MEEKKNKTAAVVPQQIQQAEFAMSPAGQQVKLFEVVQRKAQMFASSTIVPDTYKNNVGNCVIALEMAERMNAVPLMIMQNLYIVHGNPAFSSKFLIASINASKRFSPLRYEFKGEDGNPDYGCRVYAYEATDIAKKEPLYGDWITMQMAEREGWTKKAGSKWLSMPNQMLRYRAAAFWQRAYCPEISMGLITAEEAQEIEYVPYEEVSLKTGEIITRAETPEAAAQIEQAETPLDKARAAMATAVVSKTTSSQPKKNTTTEVNPPISNEQLIFEKQLNN